MDASKSLLPTLHVQNPWFGGIKEGEKIIEGRTGAKGDHDYIISMREVTITNGGEKITKIVGKVVHFNTLVEYIEACGWYNVAPHTKTLEGAIKAYREVKNPRGEFVFSDEKIKAKGGINALYLR